MIQILVTGANGQLGSEIRDLSSQYPFYCFSFIDIAELDLTRFDKVRNHFIQYHPDVIINCAAYTAVDKAEEDKEMALLLNARLPGLLAEISSGIGALLIHFSTDYVFNGMGSSPYKETDDPDPQSCYGITKWEGEKEIRLKAKRAVIIRTSWLYSKYGKNFVKTILEKAREVKQLRVVQDQVGSPTYAKDLAYHILELLPHFLSRTGIEIYHYANEGVTNWYEFAGKIIEMAGIHCEIEAVETKDYPTLAVRPLYSILDKQKIKAMGISIPDWKSSLSICIQEILQNKV